MNSENLDLAVHIRNIMRGGLCVRHNEDGKAWIERTAMRITDVVEGLD